LLSHGDPQSRLGPVGRLLVVRPAMVGGQEEATCHQQLREQEGKGSCRLRGGPRQQGHRCVQSSQQQLTACCSCFCRCLVAAIASARPVL